MWDPCSVLNIDSDSDSDIDLHFWSWSWDSDFDFDFDIDIEIDIDTATDIEIDIDSHWHRDRHWHKRRHYHGFGLDIDMEFDIDVEFGNDIGDDFRIDIEKRDIEYWHRHGRGCPNIFANVAKFHRDVNCVLKMVRWLVPLRWIEILQTDWAQLRRPWFDEKNLVGGVRQSSRGEYVQSRWTIKSFDTTVTLRERMQSIKERDSLVESIDLGWSGRWRLQFAFLRNCSRQGRTEVRRRKKMKFVETYLTR